MVIWCCAITFAKEFMPDAKAVALSRSLDYLRAITHSTLPWCHAGKSAWLGLFFLPPTTFSNMLQIERSQEALPWNWRKFKILEKVNCANSLIIAQLGVFPLEIISFWLVALKKVPNHEIFTFIIRLIVTISIKSTTTSFKKKITISWKSQNYL